MRYSDCDISYLVNQAMRDILAGCFDSKAVHEVMQRRAGSLHDYQRVREARDVAVMVKRHCGRAA